MRHWQTVARKASAKKAIEKSWEGYHELQELATPKDGEARWRTLAALANATGQVLFEHCNSEALPMQYGSYCVRVFHCPRLYSCEKDGGNDWQDLAPGGRGSGPLGWCNVEGISVWDEDLPGPCQVCQEASRQGRQAKDSDPPCGYPGRTSRVLVGPR